MARDSLAPIGMRPAPMTDLRSTARGPTLQSKWNQRCTRDKRRRTLKRDKLTGLSLFPKREDVYKRQALDRRGDRCLIALTRPDDTPGSLNS